MTSNSTQDTIRRGNYGEILRSYGVPEPVTLSRGAKILSLAVRRGLVDAPYCEVDHKHRGSALNYDIYDAAPGAVLVQRRYTICTKYGSSPQKTYLLLRRTDRKITVASADGHKAVLAKLAKQVPKLGAIIAHCEGRKSLKLKEKPAPPPEDGYKLVRRDEVGNLVSVWDGSPWTLGVKRTERALADHNGGLYYYRTAQEALTAAADNDIFGTSRAHSDLVMVRVNAAGRRIQYSSGKIAATHLTPTEIVSVGDAAVTA